MARTVVVAVATALCLLIMFVPKLSTEWWHLQNGDSIRYQDRTIPVPHKWRPEIKAGKLELTELPLTLFSQRRPYRAWAFLAPIAVSGNLPLEERYKSFVKLQRGVRSQGEATVEGPLTIGDGDNEAICMKSTRGQKPSRATVSCLMFRGSWTAEFIGSETELQNFFDVVKRAK
jgi:hypothetical protein